MEEVNNAYIRTLKQTDLWQKEDIKYLKYYKLRFYSNVIIISSCIPFIIIRDEFLNVYIFLIPLVASLISVLKNHLRVDRVIRQNRLKAKDKGVEIKQENI